MHQETTAPDSNPSGEGLTGRPGRPLIVGEVLFDVMPDGTRVLGGAPFNVAWHLEAFGLRPLMVTRVGTDDSGDEVLAAMESWGMDTSGVQRDDGRPTGCVQVDLQDGEPSFQILPNQAYDHLDRARAMELVTGEAYSLLYHGSLISRGDVSRAAVDGLKKESKLPVFVDVNLRDPWWDQEDVVASVRQARWVKLNESELDLLSGGSVDGTAEAFRANHALDVVVVTRGGRGAVVVDDGGTLDATPPAEVDVVDTVGAGDALSAVFILGLTRGWSTEATLKRALDFAAAMCTVPGATVRDHGFYSKFRDEGWW
jgi:fructokinase